MKIFFINDQAFVELREGRNYLLCIGTKQEVDEADGNRLMAMIREAFAVSEYRNIDNGKHRALH